MIIMTAAFPHANAIAANRIFNLHLKNIDSKPATFTIKTVGPCYEGSPGLGEIFANVAPGAQATITLARIQGHGCDGKGGELGVEFNPPDGHRSIQNFQFDNAGSHWLTAAANTYGGKLSAKAADESYTYTTVQSLKVSAGKAIGSWEPVCAGMCNRNRSKETTLQKTAETTHSQETMNAVSVALEAGVEFGGASAKTTVTASQEKRIGQSMSESFMRGETNTDTSNYVLSTAEMRGLNIYAVWQWAAKTKLNTGEEIVVLSNNITCTRNAEKPKYLPGSPEDLVACKGGAAPAASAAAPAAASVPDLQGTYQRESAQNDWHKGTLRGQPLRWTNAAGATWGFDAQPLRVSATELVLQTNTENPYFKSGGKTFDFVLENGKVVGFRFFGEKEMYRRTGN
ncbi:hypothetical protein [Candidatus Accumulibacter sp. ACC003]|uniref:hypothetical protein n=1 Tax=Candidatus Accumulibacter sp. ACC003 TaxID=2823334 RepID=UPI0025BDD8AC|nr:hypothetical protein [Candidatus Accumulibacter sp. ACC003]